DAVRDADLIQIIRQHLFREIRLLLVQIHRKDLKVHRGPPPDVEQQVKQCIAVLSARQAHHHTVALFDHAEVRDRLAHFLEQLCFCFTFYEQISYCLPNLLLLHAISLNLNSEVKRPGSEKSFKAVILWRSALGFCSAVKKKRGSG